MVLAQEGQGKGRHVQSMSTQPRCARNRCCGTGGDEGRAQLRSSGSVEWTPLGLGHTGCVGAPQGDVPGREGGADDSQCRGRGQQVQRHGR